MGWWILVGAVLAGTAAVVAVLWRVDESEMAAAADRFARRVDLALPPELAPVVAQRLVRRRRANLVAACVAVVALLAFATWRLDAGDGDGTDLAVGVLAAARPDPRGALLDVTAACLGMWALIELTVRAVVRARPAASDVQSLAFDDALRADAARRLLGTIDILLLVAGLFIGLAGLSSAVGRPWSACTRSAARRCRACRSVGRPGPTTAGGSGRPRAPRGRPCS